MFSSDITLHHQPVFSGGDDYMGLRSAHVELVGRAGVRRQPPARHCGAAAWMALEETDLWMGDDVFRTKTFLFYCS